MVPTVGAGPGGKEPGRVTWHVWPSPGTASSSILWTRLRPPLNHVGIERTNTSSPTGGDQKNSCPFLLELDRLAGQPICLRLVIKSTDLHSICSPLGSGPRSIPLTDASDSGGSQATSVFHTPSFQGYFFFFCGVNDSVVSCVLLPPGL
jgi:hypothetical protein